MELAGSLVGSSMGDGGVVPAVDANAAFTERDFDLNVGGGVDFDGEGGGGGGLHGVDLNEDVNYILHEGFDLNEEVAVEGRSDIKMIDLNEEAIDEEAEMMSVKRVKWFDLNVEVKEDDGEEEGERPQLPRGDKGKAILEEVAAPEPALHAFQMAAAPSRLHLRERFDGESSAAVATPMPSFLTPSSFSARDYGMYMYAAGLAVYNQFLPFPVFRGMQPPPPPPPKVELPSPSTSLGLGGADLLHFLSVYAFLRSFSTLLFLSPFGIEEFAASLLCNDCTSLFDSVHLSLLRAIRRCLSGESSVSASTCLRSLNWDLLDSITWPVFLVQYLLLHKPKHIPGLDLSDFELYQSDYYSMPPSAKVAILQQLCDDLNETKEYRSEVNKRATMAQTGDWKMRYFSSKEGKKSGKNSADGTEKEEEEDNDDVNVVVNMGAEDGNGDECYLCKMDGTMICCDACPAAIHSRCVGVVSSLLPEGPWLCPECAHDKCKPYNLASSIRATELLGTDPHGRRYYSTCNYLAVSDSCADEFSFSLYNRDDIPAVVAALQSSPVLHERIIRAISRHWTSPFPSAAQSTADSSYQHVAAEDGGKAENHHGSTESSQAASISTDNKDNEEPLGTPYVNLYDFAFLASSFSKVLARHKSGDGARTAEQIMARQVKVFRDKHATMFSWSNMYSLNMFLNSKKERCGWCFTCKNAEDGRDCLFIFIMNVVPAIESFTSEALGIHQARSGSMRKHLTDVICHVLWIESRLQSHLQEPRSNPGYSDDWRRDVREAANVTSLKSLILQLELSLDRRALSANWTKHADIAVTKGSDGVRYSQTVEFAKRIKCTAWRAAVERLKSVEQLALQVRELDTSIRWNDIHENINVVPTHGRETQKCIEAFQK